jgi:hypothetical protein
VSYVVVEIMQSSDLVKRGGHHGLFRRGALAVIEPSNELVKVGCRPREIEPSLSEYLASRERRADDETAE